jgi:thiaminase/transcriptional activator TenA
MPDSRPKTGDLETYILESNMHRFHEALIDNYAALLERIRLHPFIAEVVDGSLPVDRFRDWVCQEYRWLLVLDRFLVHLASRAPGELERGIYETVVNMGGHLAECEHNAHEHDINLAARRLGYAGHAYTQFLLAAVHVQTFEEALTISYATHYAYFDAWSGAKSAHGNTGPWKNFVDQRSVDELGAWVERQASYVDQCAADAPPETQKLMAEAFRQTLHYQIRYWDAALEGEDW